MLSVVIFGVLSVLILIVIIVVVCVWKKYGIGTYWPWQAERDQRVELEDNIQNKESRSDSATAANPPPQTKNES